MPSLVRTLTKWDLAAIGINQMIGGSIFLMPSQISGLLGGWAFFAYVAVGIASLLVALSFAEAGSRFNGTGGPYVYTREAFGRFAGFQVGWMIWLTRTTSLASVVNGLAIAVFMFLPGHGEQGRIILITAVIATFTWINYRGVRLSSNVITFLTIGKLLPLICLIAVWFFSPHLNPTFSTQVNSKAVGDALLLLIFMFGGYDVIPVPAGEAKLPTRTVPFALITAVLFVASLFSLLQLVAETTVPNLAGSQTPLADSGRMLMGSFGAVLVAAGSILAMSGNNMGQLLTGSREAFAMAAEGDLPKPLAYIHPRYRTPSIAIVMTAIIGWVLAVSGSFAVLAMTSAVARLLVYVGTCGAVIRLRNKRFNRLGPAHFTLPFGSTIPLAAIVISLAVLAGASAPQIRVGLIALVVGAVVYLFRKR